MNHYIEAAFIRQARKDRPGGRPMVDVRSVWWLQSFVTNGAQFGDQALPIPDRDFLRLWFNLIIQGTVGAANISLMRWTDSDQIGAAGQDLYNARSLAAGINFDIPIIGAKLILPEAIASAPVIYEGIPPVAAHRLDNLRVQINNGGVTTGWQLRGIYIDIPL